MFGWKLRGKSAVVDWPSLAALLDDDDRRAAIQHDAPQQHRESFTSALRNIDTSLAQQVHAAGRQLHSASALVDRPTIAVAGMLNSGKTSLVSTFLSDQGKRRALRGIGNHQGTHRFVLWLPQSWQKDPQLWQLLLQRIGDALGAAPVDLDQDPETAWAQYNNTGGSEAELQIPLIATDPGLDAAGVGLLDCPDIVSDASLGLGSPEQRRDLLGKAATLCSAFLVVTSAESSRDSHLTELLNVAADLMPGVPRVLAVNRVRPPQTPDQVHEAFARVAEMHGVDTIYAAYDFDVPKSRPFIPEDATGELTTMGDDGAAEFPVFYRVDADPDQNPPAAIDPDRWLVALPEQLDRGVLFDRFQASLQSRLQDLVCDDAMTCLEASADASRKACHDARQCLLQAVLDFFAHRDVTGEVIDLRLHQSQRIVRQLTEAFADTAPWYARWGVRLNSTVRRVFGGVRDVLRHLAPTAMAQKAADDVADKFRRGEFGGLLTPEKLQKSIQRHGGNTALSHFGDQADWNDAIETALLRFEQDDFTTLNPRRLHQAAEKMWAEVPMRRKLTSGLTPLVALFAAFAGVLMIPIDFGANFIAAASISELFAAAGLTALAALWAGDKSLRDVGHQAARQQIADFHAVLCDCFGVPRTAGGPGEATDNDMILMVRQKRLPMMKPDIIRRDSEGPALRVFHVRDEFRQDLVRQFP
ncbi:hypothetical protein [Crateriforma conspicua]|uniref:Uncharacterized protein n=1 Tax=Crateriforma conspicua TaxID=2527996 RepID=A0A5C6FRI1_9PLAN|nr:hypothetical protein [Crateriforma conspicua]TWU63168.1 hypothetical protein V7x_49080 [Crateriforma conspicua]